MPPPTKRPRSSSNDSEAGPGAETMRGSVTADHPMLKPRDELWYTDGNIVLATDKHVYRLHKGILAKQCTVFRDMFHLPVTEGEESEEVAPVCVASCSEQWEGVPLVKMVGDEDENVYHFLMALYNRGFFRTHQPSTMTFHIFSSLVNMSIKYDASEIRSELTGYLARFYPDTLEAFDKEKSRNIFSDKPAGQEFYLLRSAKYSLNAPILLPALFYACASHPLWTIFEFAHLLNKEDVNIITAGREKMLKYAYEVATSLFYTKGARCYSDCYISKTTLLKRYIDFTTYDHPPFPLQITTDGALAIDVPTSANLCGPCGASYRDSVKEIRDSFWLDLPNMFELGTWDEVRERMKAT